MKQYSVYTLALLAAVLTLAVSHTDAQISASELAGLKAIRDAFPSLNDPSPNSWSDDNLENCDGSLFTSSPNGALLSKLGCEIINGTRHPTYLFLKANQTAAIDETALAGLIHLKSLTLHLHPGTAFRSFAPFTVLNLTHFVYYCDYGPCPFEPSVIRWTNLARLRLQSAYGFSSLPESLAPLTKLTSLSIRASMPLKAGVDLKFSLLAGVSSLTHLSIFSYADGWTIVPDFSASKNLEHLVLTSNFSSIPDVFTGFTRLTYLDVSSNPRLSKLPYSLSSCVKLIHASVLNCNLSLANSFFDMSNLTNLVSIDASNNKMTSIPTSLCNLPTSLNGSNPSLTLDLQNNPITFTPCFGSNAKLTSLLLSYTKFTSFPTTLLSLSGLTRLYWHDNAFPIYANVDFSSLPKLSHLNVNIKLVDPFSFAVIPGDVKLCSYCRSLHV